MGRRQVSNPTHGSTSTHCVLRLNLIKSIFNIYHSRLTHTLAYIQQTTWHHLIPNPSIHLSCISSYLKPQHTSIIHGIISYPRLKHRHGSNQISIYHIQGIAYILAHHVHQNSHHFHQGKTRSYPQKNACSCECMPYLTTSQHLCINAWTCYMHVHGKIKG